jgi:hypothetical protein
MARYRAGNHAALERIGVPDFGAFLRSVGGDLDHHRQLALMQSLQAGHRLD